MNPTKRIGRYVLPLLNVAAMQERPEKTGWRRLLFWQKSGYDVTLLNGHTIHFTYQEKAEYDEAMEWHALTMNVYGACRGLGLRG